jgi:hypothetical protein
VQDQYFGKDQPERNYTTEGNQVRPSKRPADDGQEQESGNQAIDVIGLYRLLHMSENRWGESEFVKGGGSDVTLNPHTHKGNNDSTMLMMTTVGRTRVGG